MKNNKKEKFLWGVVNIGQQTEGNNCSSNWETWARRELVPRICGANNYWNDYSGQHQLVEDLGCNSLRITIEWSRIEPSEGVFDKGAIEHYRRILEDLRRRKVTAVVGLWHWGVPMWFEEKYGMHSHSCVKKFLYFVECMRDELGDLIKYMVVLNEPSVYISASYVSGTRPPFLKSYRKSIRVRRNLVKMHKGAYKLWKEKYPQTSIGSAYLYNHEAGRDNSFIQKTYLQAKRFLQNGLMIQSLQKYSDYIGINYYTSDNFFFGKSGGRWGVHGMNNWHSPDVWKHFPQGLYFVLMQIKKYKKPILILENGKPTHLGVDDVDRQEFLQQSTECMQKAIECGVDVRGYFHYSLCDSYEWDSGYNFKFGLVEFNRNTGEKIKRNSCDTYKQIIDKY